MKRLASIALMLLLGACAQPSAVDVAGTWEGTMRPIQEAGLPAPVTMHLNADSTHDVSGSLFVLGGENDLTGTVSNGQLSASVGGGNIDPGTITGSFSGSTFTGTYHASGRDIGRLELELVAR